MRRGNSSAAEKLKDHEEVSHSEESSHDSEHDSDSSVGFGKKKGEEGEGPWLVSYADMMTLLMGFFALMASFSKPDQKEFARVQEAATAYFGGKIDKPYEELEKHLKEVIKQNQLDKQVKVVSANDGLTMTFTGTFFFESCDFVPKTAAREVLSKMVSSIKSTGVLYNTLIEGHTDPRPIDHPIIKSNWELSGIRAARIALLFEEFGFKKEQLTIVGWGETRPEFSNYNSDGSPNMENQTQNRRVVIKVTKPLPQESKK
ncbi:MAG TPA: flagellar motor protein MotB [Pseudobdellovibrionaceae bacterium]|nr:flagellar motor protein MotB [Pseudobdellovibrionaceae bacterium]